MGPAALLSQGPRRGAGTTTGPFPESPQWAPVAAVSAGQQCKPTRQMGGRKPVKDLPKTNQTSGQIRSLSPTVTLWPRGLRQRRLVLSPLKWTCKRGMHVHRWLWGSWDKCPYLHKQCLLKFLSFLCKYKSFERNSSFSSKNYQLSILQIHTYALLKMRKLVLEGKSVWCRTGEKMGIFENYFTCFLGYSSCHYIHYPQTCSHPSLSF